MANVRAMVVALAFVGNLLLARSVRDQFKGNQVEGDQLEGDQSEGDQSEERIFNCFSTYYSFNETGAEEQCQTCAKQMGCKWCSLEQECHNSGKLLWGGQSCQDIGEEYTHKVKSSKKCGAKRPAWALIMDETFGTWWTDNTDRVLDGVKCVQWSLGWPLSGFDSTTDTPEDEEGLWACMSVLVRNVMLESLGVAWDGSFKGKQAALLQTGAGQNASAGQPAWYLDHMHIEPKLCKLILLKYPKMKCYTRTWSVDRFKELMMLWHKSDDGEAVSKAVADSIRKGPLISMVPGAGKSGSSFAETADGIFKVKMKLKYNGAVNEPENLMGLVNPEASTQMSMAEHFEKNPDSLLNRPYGLFKLRIGPQMTYILLIGDAFYGMDSTLTKLRNKLAGSPIKYHRYDLKGASRNQSERLYTGYSLINGDFNYIEGGKVHLNELQCSRLYQAIKRDTEFLTMHNMIDYSILLLSAKKEDTGADFPRCPEQYQNPLCVQSELHLYTFSIIDYVNKFSLVKGIESTLRGGKFQNYGEGIADYSRLVCPTMTAGDEHGIMEEDDTM